MTTLFSTPPRDAACTRDAPRSPRIGFERAVELGQRHLAVDAVYLSELSGGGETCRAVAGDAASFDIAVDELVPGQASYGRDLVSGAMASCVGDAAGNDRLGALAEVTGAPVGSFIGVPLWLSDGGLFGALCGLSHRACPNLDERDTRFLAMLADLIIDDLDEQRRAKRLEADLSRLIEREDVRVAYQPIVDLRNRRCIGVEALARFPEPYGSPDLTLAAAESVGLRVELERLLVSQAWSALPMLGRDQFLAMNLAPDALVGLAARANLRPEVAIDKVVIEITEHSVVESYAALHRELEPLRRRGLRIAVDDAGAGYSSLRHVLELRPDFIKVDRWLIDGIAGDHARRVAVSAFLSLARDLGALVIAEGLEQRADLALVRRLGLDAAQGYLLGRPTTDLAALAGVLASTASREADQTGRWHGKTKRRDAGVPVGGV